jgi:hypothetical protein
MARRVEAFVSSAELAARGARLIRIVQGGIHDLASERARLIGEIAERRARIREIDCRFRKAVRRIPPHDRDR